MSKLVRTLSARTWSPSPVPVTCPQQAEVRATLARWFWNHTWTTRTLSPVSAASVSLTLKKQSVRHEAWCLEEMGTLCRVQEV